MCPTCDTTLDQSNSADRPAHEGLHRATRIAAGDTKSEIKAQLVDEFGERVLAVAAAGGLQPARWVLPLVGLLGGAAVLGIAGVALEPRRRAGR